MTDTSHHPSRLIPGILLAATFLTIFLNLSSWPAAAAGQILYVDRSAMGSGDGSSWADAYPALESALAAAGPADEIWVAAGLYTPTTRLNDADPRTATFYLTRTVRLYGGFAATETLRSQRSWAANPTILSGDIDGNGQIIDNAYHVIYLNGVTTGTVIDGFTLTGGYANGSYPHNAGGGLFCDGAEAACSPTLANLIFSENRADFGGGMFLAGFNHGSSPLLERVTFDRNLAEVAGGGLYNDGSGGESSPMLSDVVFSFNRAAGLSGGSGGAMFNNGNGGSSSPSLTNVTFRGNWAGHFGGAIFNSSVNGGQANPRLENVLFSGNLASNAADIGRGGAIYNRAFGAGSGSSPILVNVTLSGNMAFDAGGGLYNTAASGGVSSPSLVNGILWGNFAGQSGSEILNDGASLEIATSLVAGSLPGGIWNDSLGVDGGGNLDEDPHFLDPAPAPNPAAIEPTTAGDYRLFPSSPAVNRGSNLAVTSGTDLGGTARIVAGEVDMGAYEAFAAVFLPLAGSP